MIDKSWLETYHEIVRNPLIDKYPFDGRGDEWNKCFEWTNEFEELNKGRYWDGEFFDEIDKFVENKCKLYGNTV